MSKVDYCTPPPHVVTHQTLAIVLAALVSLVAGFGSFVYAQARDAGEVPFCKSARPPLMTIEEWLVLCGPKEIVR